MRLFPMQRLPLVVAVTVLQSAFAAAAEQHYNLTADWSDAQNPNGVWSYNVGDLPIGIHQTFWWGESGWGNSWIADGAILIGSYPTGVTDPWGQLVAPPHDWQDGDVMMAALSEPYGGLFNFTNVRWTSPASGTIDVNGRAWEGEIFADRDVRWELIVDGQTIAQRSSVEGLYRTDAGASFGANLVAGHSLTGIPVDAGDVVEFRVVATTYYGHFVGVEESIRLIAVPEPAALALVAAGLVGLTRYRRGAADRR